MTKRTTFNVDKTVNTIAKYAVFDRIVNEIDPEEIPAKYIDQIRVLYQDGSVVLLSGKELEAPLPTARHSDPQVIEKFYRQMKEVRLFLNNVILEQDISAMVETHLGKHC